MNVKAVFGRKLLSRLKRVPPPKWRFWGKESVGLKFWFCNPKRHTLDVFCVKISAGVLGVDDLKNSPPKKKRINSRVNNMMCEIAHAQKRNPLSDLDEILQDS